MKGTQCFYLRAKSRDLMVDLDSKQRAMGIARHLSQIATARNIYTLLLLIKKGPGPKVKTGSFTGRPDLEVPRASRRNIRTWGGNWFPTPLGFHARVNYRGKQVLLTCNIRHYAKGVRERPNS